MMNYILKNIQFIILLILLQGKHFFILNMRIIEIIGDFDLLFFYYLVTLSEIDLLILILSLPKSDLIPYQRGNSDSVQQKFKLSYFNHHSKIDLHTIREKWRMSSCCRSAIISAHLVPTFIYLYTRQIIFLHYFFPYRLLITTLNISVYGTKL